VIKGVNSINCTGCQQGVNRVLTAGYQSVNSVNCKGCQQGVNMVLTGF